MRIGVTGYVWSTWAHQQIFAPNKLMEPFPPLELNVVFVHMSKVNYVLNNFRCFRRNQALSLVFSEAPSVGLICKGTMFSHTETMYFLYCQHIMTAVCVCIHSDSLNASGTSCPTHCHKVVSTCRTTPQVWACC